MRVRSAATALPAVLRVLVAASLVYGECAAAQPQTPNRSFSGRAQVTAVDLLLTVEDARGEVPADLGPADFAVVEDGVARPVVGVEVLGRRLLADLPTEGAGPVPALAPAPPPPATWRTVIYVDQVLSSSRSIRRAAEALAAEARRLTALGPVEIVAADPIAHRVLLPTRSSQLLEQTLIRMAREDIGQDALRRLRRDFTGEVQETGVRATRSSKIEQRIREEEVLLGRQHDVLVTWVGNYLEPGPRALLMVNDGYDLDPREFYFATMPSGTVGSSLDADMGSSGSAPRVRDLSRMLAASGWVTVNLALGALEAAESMDADMSGRGRLGQQFRLKGLDYFARQSDALVVHPLDPLNQLAVATGGETVTGTGKLPAALERLERKVRLTYQVERLPDGKLHRVEVESRRPGLKIKAPQWSGSPAPEAVASARARRLLAGDVARGDLPVTAAVALADGPATEDGRRAGTLQARVDLSPLRSPLAAVPPSAVRVTVAVSFPEGEPFVRSELIADQALAGLDAWTYKSPVTLPAEVDKVAVVVEEMTTSGWGGALAVVVTGALPAAVTAGDATPAGDAQAAGVGAAVAGDASRVPADLLPDRKPILLLTPPGDVQVGRVRLESVVSDPRVARVEFLLDGRPAASRDRPPFEARVEFGKLPTPRTVEAVAFDAEGHEVGRDGLTVNRGQGAFRVRIIEPREGERLGAVDVEAEVALPADAELDRVEVLWNGAPTATLFAPPYRTRILVPPEAPTGYLTVQARRKDGATAEDVVLLNGSGGGERVEVRLVELPTVVTDPASRPVRDLPRDEFRVFEEGEPQTLSDFRAAAAAPLSLGVLLDTSGSMYPVLDQVKTAAIDFLALALRPRDRAFVVDFASRPRLAQPLSGDLDGLVRAVAGLKAAGGSALCDAVVFALVEMQQVQGRRALVVLTDGVGRDERVSFDTCLRMVEHTGAPIYAILLAGDDPTAREGGVTAETLARLVGPVGGRLFFADRVGSLGTVYRAILDELHSQYLLAYYPAARPGDGGWRRVAVEVDRPGLEARTIAGYFP